MSALKLVGKSFEEFVQDGVNEYNECLEVEEDMKLELWQWRMLGDALTGLSQKPQAASREPVISYQWAVKAYSQELTVSEALCSSI